MCWIAESVDQPILEKSPRKCSVCDKKWDKDNEQKNCVLWCPMGINRVHSSCIFVCSRCATSVCFYFASSTNIQKFFLKGRKINFLHHEFYTKRYESVSQNILFDTEDLVREYNKIIPKNDIMKVNRRRLSKILHAAQDQFRIAKRYQKLIKSTNKLSELIRKIKNILEVTLPFSTHVDMETKSSDVCPNVWFCMVLVQILG